MDSHRNHAIKLESLSKEIGLMSSDFSDDTKNDLLKLSDFIYGLSQKINKQVDVEIDNLLQSLN